MPESCPEGQQLYAVSLSLPRILYTLTAAAAVIYGLAYAREAYGLSNGIGQGELGFGWIDLDRESSLPTWFSASLLLITAVLMLWAWSADRAAGRRTSRGWFTLAVGFVYLSLDESTGIHEAFSVIGGVAGDAWPIFTSRWLVVGVPAVLAAGILFIPFLRRLPRRTAMRLGLAGMVYIGGAVGMEMLNGAVFAERAGYELWIVLICLEETLEVAGILLAIRAVGMHIETESGSTLRFGGS